MKIKKISRTVSGQRYDNITLEAELQTGDDIYEVTNSLDETAKNLLDDIYEKEQQKQEEEGKKRELKWKVERFLRMIEGASIEQINKIINDNDLPF